MKCVRILYSCNPFHVSFTIMVCTQILSLFITWFCRLNYIHHEIFNFVMSGHIVNFDCVSIFYDICKEGPSRL
jgi:hypothetical protein